MTTTTTKITMLLLPEDYKPCESTDILCGRGNVYASRSANMFFQRLIHMYLLPYKKATSRNEKIDIIDTILRDVRLSGTRFLKKTKQTNSSSTNDGAKKKKDKCGGGRWYELDDVAAHKKIGHCVRDALRTLEKGNSSNRVVSSNNCGNGSSSSNNNNNSNHMLQKKKRIMNHSSLAIKQHQQKQKQKAYHHNHWFKRNSVVVVPPPTNSNESLFVDDLDDNTMEFLLRNFLEIGNKKSNELQSVRSRCDQVLTTKHVRRSSIVSIGSACLLDSPLFLCNEYPEDGIEFEPEQFFGGETKQ